MQAEFVDHDVERAKLAAMAPEHTLAFDVEGHGVEPLGDCRDFGRIHKEEYGLRIDEAADQPWTGDAVDLGP